MIISALMRLFMVSFQDHQTEQRWTHLFLNSATSEPRNLRENPAKVRTSKWTVENDGSDTVDLVDRLDAITSSAVAASVTESVQLDEHIDRLAQPAGAEFSQLSSAVKSQSQPAEPELESLADLVIE